MENKVLKIIKSRVSCRAYNEKKVSLKKALEVAEAGKYAPSGKNRQIAKIYVVNSKRYVEKLRTLSLNELNRDCMYGAKTILIVGAPREDTFTDKDCSCILENMFLDDLFNTKNGLKVKKALGIPEDYKIVGSCILGYAKEPESLQVKDRKEDFIKVL